ncbi:MAG: exonuclease domain-containing protein [Rhodocyclaceae bacterium]|nr:exonuclease domain-containing protein [Rhodocyclaceae bacterium]
MVMMACLVVAAAVNGLYANHVAPVRRMAEEIRLLLGANRERRLATTGALGELGEAVNELADQRDVLRLDVEAKIREARASVEEEKNRLAALMSELSQSVVVCNLDGRILLYNNRARLQFKALADGSAGALIGLGRSIFSVFERNLISHALETIQHRLKRAGSQPVANFVTTTRTGQLLRAQMAPVLSGAHEDGLTEVERTVTGYVLMLENITKNFETESRRDQMLQSLTEGSRSTMANIRAAVETLQSYSDMEPEQRDRFLGIIADEVRGLGSRLDLTMSDHADSMKVRWPLEEMLGMDLIAAAQRRIETRAGIRTKIEEVDENLWVKVDSFSLLQGLGYLANRLHDEFEVREVRFRLVPDGRMAHLDLVWYGATVSTETVMAWEMDPMTLGGEDSPLTLREVNDRHGGELWYKVEKVAHRAYFRLLVPVAMPQETVAASALMKGGSRPEYYDFDLFRQDGLDHHLDDRRLTDLTFTVFDTETTGLDPSQGDEIIQFGAVRIVNGRMLKAESYDQLVDPRRELTPESIPIHGISQAMLEGQPTIATVLPAFHQFCEETVLVAHNAAFDMRFLQMKQESTGIRFDHPVLDTLLLSAVIHPNQESHKLEAIAERLGVNIVGRHTALGDAIVTGEVFLKMIPLLAELGIHTLQEAQEAARKTYYARVKY